MHTLAPEHEDRATRSLELVELELALKHQNLLALGFEGTVLEALEQVNGRLLFKLRLDGVDDCDWVAAVALKEQSHETFALITQESESGSIGVEPIETSHLPVAGIVTAFAGLISTIECPR
ncbi:hypothetical protein AB2N04_15880 [Nitratireductor sp. GISD-1A_MAKvit]|uniref:hypothetical protein n=1 Tax=Nitratireductor sp. GISD-1A_MAKvit TaxID=3234198 RepID=UPI0034652AAB